jgi:rare lipoprotein A
MRWLVLVLGALLAAQPAWSGPGPQVGKASIYAKKFAHRKMADGQPMNPDKDNAAHKTLPLGTRALVRNLETGKSAVVTIQDRGPFVRGRIVDLSPATAEKIGLEKKDGLAVVELTPLDGPESK